MAEDRSSHDGGSAVTRIDADVVGASAVASVVDDSCGFLRHRPRWNLLPGVAVKNEGVKLDTRNEGKDDDDSSIATKIRIRDAIPLAVVDLVIIEN